MLYFNVLYHGLAALPTADVQLRAELDAEFQKLGKQAMHEQLHAIDPEAAARIHPNDPQRVQRALEVYRLTGKSMTQLHQQAKAESIPYQQIKLIIAPHERAVLHDKIARRFKLMLQRGFVEEVRALYERGDLTEKMPSVRAVGYRQVWAYLSGEMDAEAMQEKGIIATRQLAKRQFTWLRRETDAQLLNTQDMQVFELAYAALQRQLA